MQTKSHTPKFTNDTHRNRVRWGLCGDCTTIQERSYCIDCFEFMHNCGCGGSFADLQLVDVKKVNF